MLQNGVGCTTSSSILGTGWFAAPVSMIASPISPGISPIVPPGTKIVPAPTLPTRAAAPSKVVPQIAPGKLDVRVRSLDSVLRFDCHGGRVPNGGQTFGNPAIQPRI